MQTTLAICCGRFDTVDYSWTLSEAASGFGIKSKRLCFQHLILGFSLFREFKPNFLQQPLSKVDQSFTIMIKLNILLVQHLEPKKAKKQVILL